MSNNPAQPKPLTEGEGDDTEKPKEHGFSSENQHKKYHDELSCQGIGCSNVIPAGYAAAHQQRFFCSDACREYYHRHGYDVRKKNGTVMRKVEPRHHRGPGTCEGPGCGNPVAGGLVTRAQKHYFCCEACNHRYYKEHDKQRRSDPGRLPANRGPRHLHPRAEGPCEGPGCTNVVPAAAVLGQQKRRFCSKRCMTRYHNHRYVIGTCLQCNEPIFGPHSKEGKRKFCCGEHEDLFNAERTLGRTGPFRPMIESYLETADYAKKTLAGVKMTLWHFFSYVVSEGITQLNQIKPSTITCFLAAERKRGVTACNVAGTLATFFRTQEYEEHIERNPVIPRLHSGAPVYSRQPYNEKEMTMLWQAVLESEDLPLILAFAIGEESGLRIGEACNIRLSDIDLDSQKIFVRLPTKNKRTRSVPFHDKVKKYLGLWLQKRDPSCTHDNLLHTVMLARHNTGSLGEYFRKVMAKKPGPHFLFHRLRHTWATRLVNNDMEVAVLQELGGWVSLKSVEWYAKIRPETVDRQYAASYAKLKQHEKEQESEEESLSLLDFAMIDDPDTTTLANPGA